MQITNLTPHDINVVTANGIKTFPRSGKVARCIPTSFPAGTLGEDQIPLFKTTLGNVIDLPPSDGITMYIVSAIVREKETNRLDLVSPADLVRDDKGNVIGCKGFNIS